VNDVTAWSGSVATLISKELASVIHVQRVSDASALLVSPEQAAQLRANLRSRLLTAQLALVMRQPSLWKAELTSIEAALLARYDPQSPDTLAALKMARELAATAVVVPLPDLSDSVAALESVRTSDAAPAKAGD
jgi:uroporphyrin-3 C-methyltransferase